MTPPPKNQRIFRLPWRSRSRIARDVDTELSFHLEMRVAELVALGLSASDAAERARAEFGDIETTRRYCNDADARAERETRFVDRMSEWRQDLRYALRTTRRRPGFAIVSLITLALAIGANTSIFSVARAVLLAPLPFGHAGALAALTESSATHPADQYQLAPANYVDYKAQQHSFLDVAAYRGLGSVTFHPDHGDAEIISGVQVAPNFFTVLEGRASLGRTLVAGDESASAAPVVVISTQFFQRAFGGDRAAIGRTLMLNGHSYQLVGVMPPAFTLGMSEDIWLPYDIRDDLKDPTRARRQHYLRAIGRLKPGITIGEARTDLSTIAHRLELQYPEADKDRSATATPLRESMTGGLRSSLLLLQGAAALVLLIACANLANLTLSRTMSRRREIALRAAIGAGRARLTRQLLTESLAIAIVGGALGALLAAIATPRMLALNPDALPPMFDIRVDKSVLLFSLALSMMTGVLFGLIPALDAGRAQLHDALKEGGRGAVGGGRSDRVRQTLVVAQVALAVVLLIGAGLLMRSFGELTRVRMGFDASHVLTAELRASGERYDSSAAVNQFYDGVIADVAHTPGVIAAGATDNLPTDGNFTTALRIEGEPVDETSLPEMNYLSVRGDYFAALRIPILAGRAYDATDLPGGDSRVIINETAARRFFPRGDAIGRRIRIGPDPESAWLTIVGVAGDIRSEGVDLPTRPTIYANERQEAWEHSLAVVIRTSGDPAMAASALRAAVKRADPALAIRNVRNLSAVVDSSLGARRFSIGLAAAFALIALVLAAVGVYGVLAYSVTSRTKEFGVRLALGATARAILVLVVREGVAWATLGLVLGVAGAIAAGRLISGLLYGITPLDASTYVIVALSLLLVVIAACLVPGMRATRVDPLSSMQAE